MHLHSGLPDVAVEEVVFPSPSPLSTYNAARFRPAKHLSQKDAPPLHLAPIGLAIASAHQSRSI